MLSITYILKTMKQKMRYLILFLLSVLVLNSCDNKEEFDVKGDPKNRVYINIGSKSTFTFKVSQTEDGPVGNVKVAYPVRSTKPMSKSVNVGVEVDNSLISAYNEKNQTNYAAFPDGIFNLDKASALFEAGSYSSSDSIEISIDKSKLELLTDGLYIAPIRLASIESAGVHPASELERTTIYLIVNSSTSEGNFTALDISNPDLYSNFIFPDDKAVSLSQYTYEIKIFVHDWHTTPSSISRLCSFTSKNEQNSNMLRFGEGGNRYVDRLQWVSPAGSYFVDKRFETNKWYTISLMHDGNKFVLYMNGDKELEFTGTRTSVFQRFELGMSWENYPSQQFFNGRIAEVRVWNKALTQLEVRNGLCSVDPSSNGLIAYWKMNEGQGHIFNDATGNGYDMDWSKTNRDNTGNGSMNPFDKSSFVNWISDDNNVCD